MKFLSIKEYFYKLNTIGFILLLLPLMVFIFLYYWFLNALPIMLHSDKVLTLLLTILAFTTLVLTIVHWALYLKLSRLKKLIELAKKMDGYYSWTIVKMTVYFGCSMLMALGYFLTEDWWYTGFFLLISTTLILQWPTPSMFCRHFKLKGSERDMILHDRLLQKNRRT